LPHKQAAMAAAMLTPGVLSGGGAKTPLPLPPQDTVVNAPFASRMAAQVAACRSDTHRAMLSAPRATHSPTVGTRVLAVPSSPGPVVTVPLEPMTTSVCQTERTTQRAPLATTTRLDIGPVVTVPLEPMTTSVCQTERTTQRAPLATTTRLDIGSATRIPTTSTAAPPPPQATIQLDSGYVPGTVMWSTTQNLNQVPLGTQKIPPGTQRMNSGSLTARPLHSTQLGICNAKPAQMQQQTGVLMQPVNGGQVLTGVGVQIVTVNQNPTGPILLLDDE